MHLLYSVIISEHSFFPVSLRYIMPFSLKAKYDGRLWDILNSLWVSVFFLSFFFRMSSLRTSLF